MSKKRQKKTTKRRKRTTPSWLAGQIEQCSNTRQFAAIARRFAAIVAARQQAGDARRQARAQRQAPAPTPAIDPLLLAALENERLRRLGLLEILECGGYPGTWADEMADRGGFTAGRTLSLMASLAGVSSNAVKARFLANCAFWPSRKLILGFRP